MSVVMSILLVAEIPLLALKFKSFAWKGNEIRYIFILVTIALLLTLQIVAVPFILIFYLAISLLSNFIKTK